MTTLSIVKNKLTLEETVVKYLDSLSNDLRGSYVTGMLVLGVGDEGPFYSVVKGMNAYECIGLIEHLKSYLIEDLMYTEEE